MKKPQIYDILIGFADSEVNVNQYMYQLRDAIDMSAAWLKKKYGIGILPVVFWHDHGYVIRITFPSLKATDISKLGFRLKGITTRLLVKCPELRDHKKGRRLLVYKEVLNEH